MHPSQLEGEVLARIPVSESWDSRYFPNDKYQGLPAEGYTRWFQRVFDHPNIHVTTNTNFFDVEDRIVRSEGALTFYTGPIDRFFAMRGSPLPPLPYRSIRFEKVVKETRGVALPYSVVNYPQYVDGELALCVCACFFMCMYVYTYMYICAAVFCGQLPAVCGR